MSLVVERKTDGRGEVRVFLRGVIDERADFDVAFKNLSGPVAFNLGGIERINSIGVNRWINFFIGYTKRHPTTLEELSYAMVMQANSIANIFGSARVTSCLAPYYCGKCTTTNSIVVSAEDVAAVHPSIPAKKCKSCGTDMVFDELNSYFDFLIRSPRPS